MALSEHTLLQDLVDHEPALMWVSDPQGSCYYSNKAWLAYTGRTTAEEQGEDWTQWVHPDDLDRCLTIYQTSFAKRQEFRMEYRLRGADGCYNSKDNDHRQWERAIPNILIAHSQCA